jgi:hypothetical protein
MSFMKLNTIKQINQSLHHLRWNRIHKRVISKPSDCLGARKLKGKGMELKIYNTI